MRTHWRGGEILGWGYWESFERAIAISWLVNESSSFVLRNAPVVYLHGDGTFNGGNGDFIGNHCGDSVILSGKPLYLKLGTAELELVKIFVASGGDCFSMWDTRAQIKYDTLIAQDSRCTLSTILVYQLSTVSER